MTVYEMPRIALDRWIPMIPWTIWLYFSLWVYICLPVALLARISELRRYLIGAVALSIIGLTIFLLAPTTVPDSGLEWEHYPVMAFLKQSDAAGNACPSLHVGFACFAFLWLHWTLRDMEASKAWLFLNSTWCVLIALSTITTRQHVVLDGIAGAFLGLLVGWANLRSAKRTKSHPLLQPQ